MMNKNIKDVIDSRLSYMKIDLEMKENLLEKASPSTIVKTHKRFKKPMIAAAAVILCLLLSVPILGAVSEGFNNILFGISPQLAEILMPLDEECTSNGIKMEVLAAAADEEYSIVYLTLQDVEEDRLRNIGFFNSIISSYNWTATSSYDKENRTIYISLLNEGSFDSSEPQTLTLKDLDVAEANSFGLDLSEVQDSEGIQCKYEGYSYRDSKSTYSIAGETDDSGETTVLQPDGHKIELPTRLQISNIGYIDGKLHVQTITPWGEKEYSTLLLTNAESDSYSWYEITTMGADFRSCDYCFDLKGLSDDNFICREYIFDTTPEDLVGYKLLIMENNYIEGEWTASFRISVYESQHINCNVAAGDSQVAELTLSPIRMKIDFLGKAKESEPFDVVLKMKSGETVKYSVDLMKDGHDRLDASEGYELTNLSIDITDTGYIINLYPSVPFDVDNIAEITVNNVVVS